jgi:hypothetical protein
MNIHGSYFSITSPLTIVDRWLNPFRYKEAIYLNGKSLRIELTHRADNALQLRDTPLIVEMQLYFSCVVKKRLLFHNETGLEKTVVSDKLSLAFRPVEALSCDPVEFANKYPVKRQLTSKSAIQMHPSLLQVDFKQGNWSGQFMI